MIMAKVWKKTVMLFGLMLVVTTGYVSAATVTVTSRENSGPGTLRQLIADAASGDTIEFSTGGNSITVYSGLTINKRLVIDGGGTQVIGASAGFILFFLDAGASNTIFRNLSVVRSGQAFYFSGTQNAQLLNCRIGVDWADTAQGHSWGIMVQNCNGMVIGAPGMGNVISSNSDFGIVLKNSTHTTIQSNFIGTDSTGMLLRPNGSIGIRVADGSAGTLIGGNSAAGEGNIISGNGGIGVEISDSDGYGGNNTGNSSFGNTLAGNTIGLNILRTAVLGNNSDGVHIAYSSDNWVGLPEAGKGNVIAGNDNLNLYLDESARIRVQNNFVGCNESGVAYGGNYGCLLNNVKGSLVGGNRYATAYESNVFSGHALTGRYGLAVQGAQSNGNTVAGNFIGTNATGSAACANYTGVVLTGGGNLLGGLNSSSTSLYGNVISGNTNYGVDLSGSGNVLLGNYIGLDAVGTAALPNVYGVVTTGGVGNTIGNGTSAGRNVLSGNSWDGLRMEGATRHEIFGNYFGTNANGTQVIANGRMPIWMTTARSSMIGGAGGNKNIICGSGNTGIFAFTADVVGNTMAGNWLDTYADGTIATPKLTYGIWLQNGPEGNFLGLQSTGLGNMILGAQTGILLSGATTSHNSFYANTICSFANPATDHGVIINDAGNDGISAPVITAATVSNFSGTSVAGANIQIFRADRGNGFAGGSVALLGTTTANGSGHWSWTPSGLVYGDFVCALATDTNNNTSMFSNNIAVSGWATPTPTATISPTVTVTPTSTNTPVLLGADLMGRAFLPYPNPAVDRMIFAIENQGTGAIKIQIYNLSGERVATLEAGPGLGNQTQAIWKCSNAAPGLYVARVMQDGKEIGRAKVAVVR